MSLTFAFSPRDRQKLGETWGAVAAAHGLLRAAGGRTGGGVTQNDARAEEEEEEERERFGGGRALAADVVSF